MISDFFQTVLEFFGYEFDDDEATPWYMEVISDLTKTALKTTYVENADEFINSFLGKLQNYTEVYIESTVTRTDDILYEFIKNADFNKIKDPLIEAIEDMEVKIETNKREWDDYALPIIYQIKNIIEKISI